LGYHLSTDDLNAVITKLAETYRLYAPVLKVGEGRFTDVDVIRYDFITKAEELELDKKSDYSFKEILTPLSETLFYFTENDVKEADQDPRDVIVFLRSCDMHAVKRFDQIYLENGPYKDYFYERVRDKVHFALIGCKNSGPDCFCVDMKSNKTEDGYLFSIERDGDGFRTNVLDEACDAVFSANNSGSKDVTPSFVTGNETRVSIPAEVPNSIYKSEMWNEYTARCINCGRCNYVCPTCTCFNMQDVYYTDNGKVGERRRVGGSCMVDGYTNVAGGGQYRRTNGERMRFKVLHKVYDFRKRFGYDMCVGCGRCDAVCPEYISFSHLINKLDQAVKEEANGSK